MTDSVVVAGDVHLGSANADAAAFEGFLDDLYERRETITELVLVGDVWDLVRRDPFGCAWESSETIVRLQRLAEEMPVRIVLGNHDTYLHALDNSRYEIEFLDEYVLTQGRERIRFCHGNAFDRFQFDALSSFLSGPGDRGEIDPTGGRKDRVLATVRRHVRHSVASVLPSIPMLYSETPSSIRRYTARERRAHDYLATIPETKLIYGHTHAPYVHHENHAANPGSWKATAPRHNTYLEITDGAIELYQYRQSGPDERID